MKDMKNITIQNNLDWFVLRMWDLSKDNAVEVPDPGIKIVALIIDKKGNIALGRRNERTKGFKESTSHAEYLCIKSKDFPELNNIKSIYVTIPPCQKCRELIDKADIKNIYYLFDHNNQSKRQWNKNKVILISKNRLNDSSITLIESLELTFNNNDFEAKKRPRPKR